MYFNSFEFAVFFMFVAGSYWAIRGHRRARVGFLLIASYYFYMCWNWKFASLILFSTILDFSAGRQIYRAQSMSVRRTWLAASLVGNLGLLAVFKYGGFFLQNLDSLFAAVSIKLEVPMLDVMLPVGISFYTFQTLSYTIDIYRKTLEPTNRFADFALFVAFFPQLVAGPIVRASHFLPQLCKNAVLDHRRALDGVALIMFGLFKKICIADALAASLVDPAFGNPSEFSGLTLLFAVYGYALQIYCDFSGYSDIAIGAAKVLGFEIPANFNRPYFALSITDFWRRWHLSLSSWLRDYLYIPLGGNQKGRARTYANLLITMLLGGLWHGAAWNFVFWGGLHGSLLAVERAYRSRYHDPRVASRGPRIIQWAITFHLVCVGWVLFRATSLESGLSILKRIGSMSDGIDGLSVSFVVTFLLGYALHFSPGILKRRMRSTFVDMPVVGQAAVVTFLLLFYMSYQTGGSPFIYFQF